MAANAIADGRSITGFSLETWRTVSAITRLARQRGFQIPALAVVGEPPGGVPLPAIVNHGRWVVECPGPCRGALEVWREGPWLFFCLACGNSISGGAWLPVSLPADADEIEAILLAEPDPARRNWAPPGYQAGG